MNKENKGKLPGVIFSSGHYWRELRRFMLRNLRDVGFGKSSMEDLFHDEVAKLCQFLEKRSDQALSLSGTFNVSIVNALWSIITGEKLDMENPASKKVVDSINHLVRNANPLSPLTAALPHPSMAKWPILSKLTGFSLMKNTFGPGTQMMFPYAEEHKRTLDPEHARDFLDLMLVEQQNAKDPESPFYGKIGTYTIVNAMMDLFFAGMETTSSSLLNLFLQLLHHPDVQEKVHQEIEKVNKKFNCSKNSLWLKFGKKNM
jgi:methyl farnesoate epoxidase/farnesoate epoxidase